MTDDARRVPDLPPNEEREACERIAREEQKLRGDATDAPEFIADAIAARGKP